MTAHFQRPRGIARLTGAGGAITLVRPAHRWPVEAAADQRDMPLGGRAKRAMDIAVSLTALVLLAPLMLIIAGIVKVTMGGPVIFSQRRVGYRGVPFACHKFRSMVVDGDRMLTRHLAHDASAAEEWRTTRKLRVDPRVTWFGQVLRKSSLDELPQLFNILVGEMSCVGPRPVMPDEIERYGKSASAYLRTRPGLTGLWQVSGRSRLSYEERVALDAAYVEHWSMWGDVKIMARTLPAVLAVDATA